MRQPILNRRIHLNAPPNLHHVRGHYQWQFYLLAPSILLALKSNFGRIAIFVMVALGSAAATRGYFGNFEVASFILLGSAYFSLGIASRLSFETLSDMRIEVATAATLSIVALAATAGLPLPVLVWLAFYFVLLWHKEMGMLGRLFNYLFASPAVLAVGRSSYSLYLLHRPFQVALGAIALFWLGANRQLMLSFELMAIVLTIPAALLFYEYVEKPGMALGKRLAGGLPLSNQRA
jgi:peptidoglycan/LPS O-acetylase OafA/YrhL